MGFSPQQVDAMSVWQYVAAVEGYQKAHDPKGDGKLAPDEVDDIAEWLGI